VQDLQRAGVSFAQGPWEAGCSRVHSLLWFVNAVPIQACIQQVLQPQFWVGTEFFVWVSMLYGDEVKVHFFGADKIPTVQSTHSFLQQAFPNTTFIYPNHDIVQD
jgi:hypothetical protein